MTRDCSSCGQEVDAHQTATELIMYCTSCGHEEHVQQVAPRPQWDRAPVKKVSTIAQIKPNERAAKVKRDRDSRAQRRGAR